MVQWLTMWKDSESLPKDMMFWDPGWNKEEAVRELYSWPELADERERLREIQDLAVHHEKAVKLDDPPKESKSSKVEAEPAVFLMGVKPSTPPVSCGGEGDL